VQIYISQQGAENCPLWNTDEGGLEQPALYYTGSKKLLQEPQEFPIFDSGSKQLQELFLTQGIKVDGNIALDAPVIFLPFLFSPG
jgi:hypothetical protein